MAARRTTRKKAASRTSKSTGKSRAKSRPKAKPKAQSKAKRQAKAKPKRATPKAKSRAKARRARPPSIDAALTLTVPTDLDARLGALAEQMELTFDALLLQALCEFADAWEDHFRTVAALAADDDRVQLAVTPE